MQPLIAALKPLASRLTEAFVYEPVPAGQGTGHGEVYLALVGEVDLFEVSPLLDKAEHELGRPIHVSLCSVDEWTAESSAFMRALKSGPRIDLMPGLASCREARLDT